MDPPWVFKILVGIGYAVGWILMQILRYTFWGIIHLFRAAGKSRAYQIPYEARFEHTHIVAGTGFGKTQLLQHEILSDLHDTVNKPTIIVIDSQGDLINNILHLRIVKELFHNSLVYINPKDVEYPPALNLFDFGLKRIEGYDPAQKEQVLNSAIFLYDYLFGALLGAELTAQQGMIFRYLARLMMVIPNANIETFMEIMSEPELARGYLDELDPMTRTFFLSHFAKPMFDNTRERILNRILMLFAEAPQIARMFTHETNAVDMFGAMNKGSLILINTAKDFLQPSGCELLGRFFIALIAQATQERSVISPAKRKPTMVYIDEAHDYFDDSLERLFVEARKFRVGLIIAHQSLAQLNTRLQKIIMSNTATKIVGGVSAEDASVFAREMQGEPGLILQHAVKTKDGATFASVCKNVAQGQGPGGMFIPFGLIDRQPKLTKEEYDSLIDANRMRFSMPRRRQESKTETRAPVLTEEPDLI